MKQIPEEQMIRSDIRTYIHIAHALARACTELFYVNTDTGEFIEFYTENEHGVLTEARRGSDFFESCKREAKLYVHQDDQAAFIKAMNCQFLEEALAGDRMYELPYRRIRGKEQFYVLMNVSRMKDDERFIVIAVKDIDGLVWQRRAELRNEEERVIYTRLHAIADIHMVVYVVDPETDNFHVFSASFNYEKSLKLAKEGAKFFDAAQEVAPVYIHPDDLKPFLSVFTKKNILTEIERNGIFIQSCRLIMDGKPVYVQVRASMVEEREGSRLIVALVNIDSQVRQEEEYGKRLAQAQYLASIDALTGIKNRNAFLAAQERLDRQIAEHNQPRFALVVLDVNDLKKVNDTAGHQAGDQYLRNACKIICDVFRRSPVFRIGGDEFVVIAQGSDYECIEELIGKFNDRNMETSRTGGLTIACGMAKFDNDPCVDAVLERADRSMYGNKKKLKANTLLITLFKKKLKAKKNE